MGGGKATVRLVLVTSSFVQGEVKATRVSHMGNGPCHMGRVIGVAFCLLQVMTPHTNESDANYMVQSLLIWCNSGLMTMTSGSCVLVSMSRPLSSHDKPDSSITSLT